MFHQTPSDTIDADAGKDMGMHLSLSTDVQACMRNILAAQPRSQRCFASTFGNFQDFLVGVVIPANGLAALFWA
jgi:hypothetical protein